MKASCSSNGYTTAVAARGQTFSVNQSCKYNKRPFRACRVQSTGHHSFAPATPGSKEQLDDSAFAALLRAIDPTASDPHIAFTIPDDVIDHHDDLASLFSEKSTSCDLYDIDDEMVSNGPYYDSSTQLDLSAIDASLDGYEHGANQPARYPEPSYQQGQSSDLQPMADLQNLVAAAHSVAEKEQNQRIHATALPTSQQPQDLPAAKRKQADGLRKGRSKRRRLGQNETEGEADADSTATVTARPQGIHSAAALFRPASEKSKKWTRPPMNTIFNSFRMSPERFLQLQADAKDFMLDPAHPERGDMVGIRGQSDIKGVKLDLARAVRRFLDDGAGEKFFGGQVREATSGADSAAAGGSTNEVSAPTSETADADAVATVNVEDGSDSEERQYHWPRDRDVLIDLCMPLLRRVVTNEKQRRYAETTRRATRETSAPEGGAGQDLVAAHVYFISADGKVTTQRQGQISAQMGQAQWTGVCALLGPEALRRSIRVQTAEGLIAVEDQTGCGAAVDKVLQAPWLERMVRIVVGGDEDR